MLQLLGAEVEDFVPRPPTLTETKHCWNIVGILSSEKSQLFIMFLCWRAGEFRRTGARDDQSQDGDSVVAHVRRGTDTDLHADAAWLISEVSQLADLQTVARQQQPTAFAAAAAVYAVVARTRVSAGAESATAAGIVGLQLKQRILQIVPARDAFSLRHVRIS